MVSKYKDASHNRPIYLECKTNVWDWKVLCAISERYSESNIGKTFTVVLYQNLW